jgi:hypothetical protein
VNIFLRAIIVFLMSLTFSVGVFAESDTGAVSKSGSQIQAKQIPPVEKSDDDEETESVREAKKEKIKQEISSYIIDSYKSQ